MRYLVVLILSLVTIVSEAQSLGVSARSARSKGMGGVAVPFVGGFESLYINPAALGKNNGIQLRLLGLSAGLNDELWNNRENFSNIDGNDPTTFDPLFGKRLQAQTFLQAGLAVKGLALGYLKDVYVTAELHNPVLPSFETYYRQDDAYYLGGGFDLGEGLYAGLAVKRIFRRGGDIQELSVDDIAGTTRPEDIARRFDNAGQGYGVDFALTKEFQEHALKPSFTVVWQDIGGTSFQHKEGPEAPSHIQQNLIFGAGVSAEAPGFLWALGFEARHLLEPDLDMGKKLHLGTEIGVGIFNFRGGFNQGYFVYGAGLDFWFLKLDAARYTEELGLYPGQSSDPRYMVSLSLDLSFDADFNIADNRRSKLKQRR